jgi:superoxide dismutase, Cu-Zn family
MNVNDTTAATNDAISTGSALSCVSSYAGTSRMPQTITRKRPHQPARAGARTYTALRAFAGLLFAASLAGCATTAPAPSTPPIKTLPFQFAKVNLTPASGTLVSGRLRLIAQADGVYISGEIGGLGRERTHAMHLHEIGDCSAADASSAGGHFNPTGAAHGRAGYGAHHLGDMDNLVTNAAGVAKVDLHLRGVMLGGGGPNDIIRRAVVVHANADDYSSQPAGNAGTRIACGVVEVDLG